MKNMKSINPIIVALLCLVIIGSAYQVKAQTPTLYLTSGTVTPNPIVEGSSYEVCINIYNAGASGDFDFELDLDNTSNDYLTVVEKMCGQYIASGATVEVCFNSNSVMSESPGTYEVNLLSSYSGNTCSVCGSSPSCYDYPSSDGFNNPETVTVVSSCTAVTIGTQPQNQTVTAGQSATFSVTPNGTGPFLYFWYCTCGGGVLGTSSSYTTPALTTANSGDCYYCLVTNCSSTYEAQTNNACVTVNCAAPSPPSSISTSSGNDNYCVGTGSLTLEVNGTLSSGAQWDWYTGGCGTNYAGTGSTLNVSPSSNTTYYVMAENGTCYSSCVSITIDAINAPSTPGISVTSGTNPACISSSTTLSASNCPNCMYKWNPGNATTENITVSPSTSTTYTVTESNACGTVSSSYTLTVTDVQTPSITENPQSPSCSPIQLTANSSGCNGCNYTWSGGNDPNSATNTVSSTGTYGVTAASGSCTATASTSVTVNQTPSVSVTPSISSICSGGSQTLSATAGANNYSWSPGGYTTAQINVSPASTTTYTVTASNGNCTATATATVTVNNQPSVSILPANPVIGCGSSSVTLTLSTTGSNYSWSNGTTSSTDLVSAAGNYSVTVTNPGGCTGTATASVAVIQANSPTVNITPHLTSGGGTLNSTVSNGTGPYTYSWSPNTYLNSDTVAAPTVTGLTGTVTYTLIVTESNGCSASATATVSGNTSCDTSLHPAITVNGGCYLEVPQYAGATYTWQLTGNDIAGDTTRFCVATSIGYYSCTVVITGCAYITTDTFLNCPAAINDIEAIRSLSIIPNPSSGLFTVSFEAASIEDMALKVFNPLGQVIWNKRMEKISGQISEIINLQNTSKGFYTLQITVNNGQTTYKKIIVQ